MADREMVEHKIMFANLVWQARDATTQLHKTTWDRVAMGPGRYIKLYLQD